ncbi:MAG: DNA alkylation repair protein [Parcubacteria group bacterium]
MNLIKLKKTLRSYSSPERKKANEWFFKTGKGEYGEGDIFIGVISGDMRSVAKDFQDLSLIDVQKLLHSKIHEERQVALLILIHKFQKGDDSVKRIVFDLYIKNTDYINNWDIVDISAPRIVGDYLWNQSASKRKILYKFARSKDLWKKRIAIISTAYFIREGGYKDTLAISKILLHDVHDLIHKAVGWMLREVGKKDQKEEERFLGKYYKKMPRTMLRYSIERFPEKLRKAYLHGLI